MPLRPIFPPFKLGALALGLLLAACGGGSGSGPGAPAGNIAGVAAAGLPLVGVVTVKDALGATRSVNIGNNGSYSIDVNGMTAPFVFRAEGRAGGREYVLHSAATAADVGGVINVTPLTDLVVSNIAGEIAQRYFDGQANLGGLTAEALAAELAQLRARLLPVLTALGIDAAVDLLRTPFTPLASALDRAIDVLRVDYNAGSATITNVVTQQQIMDDLATRAAQETAAQTMDQTGGVAQAGTDIDQIRAALSGFSDQFATGVPAVGVLRPRLSADFLFRDSDAETLLADLSTFPDIVGARFTEVTIRGIDYSNASRPVADVSFVIQSVNGNTVSLERHWKLVKDNNAWLLHGDQRTLDVEVVAFMNATTYGTGSGQSCRQSGLTLSVEDNDGATDNDGGTSYVIVTGPGIAQVGIRITKPALGGNFQIDTSASNGGNGNYYVVASNCGAAVDLPAVPSIPQNAVYTFTAYTAGDVPIPAASYSDTLLARPLTLAETLASTQFPTITEPTYAAFSSFGGGALTVSASGFDPLGSLEFDLRLFNSDGSSSEARADWATPASGLYSATLTVAPPTGAVSIVGRMLEVSNRTQNMRNFDTRYVPQ